MDVNEPWLLADWLCRGLLMPRPPPIVPPLMAQNPTKRSQGWGALLPEERPGPSKGSPHPKRPLGPSAGTWEAGVNLAGGRTSRDKVFGLLPPLPFPFVLLFLLQSTCFPSRPRPLSPPSPFPLPLGGIRCMWNSLGDSGCNPARAWTWGGALSTAPKRRAGVGTA